jgi:methyltransferase (TIGR00027 family)
MDHPRILEDPIAVPLLGPGLQRDLERAMHPVARDFRAFMATRSRCAEDCLAEAVAHGASQYVVLGAGLDTFAYRNPFAPLHVFEVDFPATQQWKRAMLADAGIEAPPTLSFVPLDFEHQTLAEELSAAGFDAGRPAFFGWLGVVPYLTRDTFRATLRMIGRMPAGSGVCFDFALAPETLNPVQRAIFNALAERVARAGEPFQLFFTAQELEAELYAAGFQKLELWGGRELNARYFLNRSDELRLPDEGLGMIAAAWI